MNSPSSSFLLKIFINETPHFVFFVGTFNTYVDRRKLKKLFVTLHIRNVTMEDDSQYGSLGGYECHAYAVGDPEERKHGFNVSVISGRSTSLS